MYSERKKTKEAIILAIYNRQSSDATVSISVMSIALSVTF